MPAVSLTHSDLEPFVAIDEVKAQAMIDDALALAARVAPCITSEDFEYAGAAKAILRGAILRWVETGSGAAQSQTAGPFGMTIDTRQERRGMFWPTEITELRNLCAIHSGVYTTSLAGPDREDGYWAQPNLWVPLNGA